MREELEILKKDLIHQLHFEDMDWGYFSEMVEEAKKLADELGVNYTE